MTLYCYVAVGVLFVFTWLVCMTYCRLQSEIDVFHTCYFLLMYSFQRYKGGYNVDVISLSTL